jgi:hypothetical protein
MVYIIIFFVAGTIGCFLLLTPLVLELDSVRGICRVYYQGIASCDIFLQDGRFMLRIWVLGWRKTIDPFLTKKKQTTSKKTEPKPKTPRKRIKIKWVKWGMKKAIAVLRTFEVKDIYLNVDTDDFFIDALLYPVAFWLTRGSRWLSNGNRSFQINFNGDVEIRLRIENRIGKILFSLIR